MITTEIIPLSSLNGNFDTPRIKAGHDHPFNPCLRNFHEAPDWLVGLMIGHSLSETEFTQAERRIVSLPGAWTIACSSHVDVPVEKSLACSGGVIEVHHY